MAIVDLSKFLPGSGLKKNYADALINISSEGGLDLLQRALVPVVIVDNVSALASQGVVTPNPTPVLPGGGIGPVAGVLTPTALNAGPGVVVATGLWVASGQATLINLTLAGTGQAGPSYTFAMSPPAGWGWRVEQVDAVFTTGSATAHGAATDPVAFSISPGVENPGNADIGPPTNNLSQYSWQEGRRAGSGPLATSTSYALQLKRGPWNTGEGGNANNSAGVGDQWAIAADQYFSQWMYGTIPDILCIGPAGVLRWNWYSNQAVNQPLTNVGMRVVFSWFKMS